MRGRINRILKPFDAVAVENPAYPGTPDVNYVEGWIELKWLRRWPSNAWTAPVRLDHFTPQQRTWLLRRSRRGGNVHVLLQVGREHLLFRAPEAAALLGRAPRQELYDNALRHWPDGLRAEEFRQCLQEELESSRRSRQASAS